MMRSMTRVAVAGCMALAALGAVAVLDVGSTTAEAGPSVSPFAGSYVGTVPHFGSSASMAVTISDAGRMTGSTNFGGFVSGRVSADGSYSFTVTESGTNEDGRRRRWKSSYTLAGNMALDSDGNISGTTDTGGSFFWLRQ